MPHCPVCGSEISRQTTEQILKHVLSLKPDDRVLVLAQIVRGRKGEFRKELEKLARQGKLSAARASTERFARWRIRLRWISGEITRSR